MITRGILIAVLLMICLEMNAQVNIEKLSIYKYFPERGFTTAGLSTELSTIKANRTELISIGYEDILSLEKIMRSARVKKHHQTKTGLGPCFGVMKMNAEEIDVIIFDTLIIDMNNSRDYWVESDADRLTLGGFILRVKSGVGGQ